MLPRYRADDKGRSPRPRGFPRIGVLGVFALAVVVVFFVLQLASFEMLGYNVKVASVEHRPGHQSVHVVDAKDDINRLAEVTQSPQIEEPDESAGAPATRSKPDKVAVHGTANPGQPVSEGSDIRQLPRGVAPADATRFSGHDVLCADGLTRVPAAMINDDFCDCPGGGDEPGTAACPDGQFFCENRGHLAGAIPSTRVNDGVCDCCDGGDEWGVVSGSRCPNRCQALAAEHEKEEQQREAGRVLKRQYAEAGRAARASFTEGDPPWGPNDAFHHLHDKCFTTISTEYKYEVCWFKSVKQMGWDPARSATKSPTHVLGSQWTWEPGKTPSGQFIGGAQCFNGPARSTRVTFVCGHGEDTITRIQEDEKCVYGLTFVTAAAC